MQLPDLLKPYQSHAEALFANGAARDIEFSGSTYQVQVVDPKYQKPVWAFLQLDGKGQLKDCFCSCEESEDVSHCIHLAVAYLRIFNHTSMPLHQRFEQSLWNHLCHLYSDRLGNDDDVLKEVDDQYEAIAASGKRVFYIKGKNQGSRSQLEQLIFHRKKETEETSLKFSNLSPEEIILWKEGRPTPELLYELSFWNDLAKWLMLLQETNVPYSIHFEYLKENGIPHFIHISFANLECGFYLSQANLPLIIPALATVTSPLKVHNTDEEAIEQMTYSKEEGCLKIEKKKNFFSDGSFKNMEGISVGDWLFKRGDGFYPKNYRGLLTASEICGKEINQLFDENYHIVKNLIEGVVLHEESIPASYTLAFDKKWNLHITCYLFTPGDLNSGYSRSFGQWVYLDDDGFYHLEAMLFPNIVTIIPVHEVGDFITQNRTWLNNQEGFKTYLASIEAQLTYQVSTDHRLTFSRRVSVNESSHENKDFGQWVYIGGLGFYSKVNSPVGLPLRPDIAIRADQIPVFIRMNRAELELVPHFFSEKCPVTKAGLKIILNQLDQIEVFPEYDLLPEYKENAVIFLDDFVYVKGEGFHELPINTRLPEKFRHFVQIEPENQGLFLSYELDKIKDETSFIDPRLVKPEILILTAANITKEPNNKGWYALKLYYQTERGIIPVTQIWEAIKKKQRYLFVKEGLIDLAQKRFEWIRLLAKNRLDKRTQTLLLSTLELIRLNSFDAIEVQSGKDYEESLKNLKELTEFAIPEEANLSGLKSHLRPYQQQGLNWMWFLYHHTLSGLLCDDMGLGKTHQTMALIDAVMNYHQKMQPNLKLHFLVVCPTSVIYPWQEKLERFLPHLRVCTFHGSNRSLKDFQQEYDLLLTSYGIWRNEEALLSSVPFEVAIFDEIQIAKNHSSRIYSSLLNANAKVRIGLTGTPIENHLRELKALFDIVLPTYMPSDADYRDFFVKPIEKEKSEERRELLSRFIKPFTLRRKKEQVLLDLPEKVEEISHCELLPEQEKLYVSVLEQSRNRIMNELQDSNNPIPYIHIFALLSQLKQICDHPAVFFKQPHLYKEMQSGKWELFIELLTEARDSRQKVVVFSQYLGMLDIMENYLNEHGIGFATIRGSTSNRGEQIQRFNDDPKCEVFIGSLQAAGLGIDLTAASVVIHYDRWWNAAKENQATDRVHRIGQTRGVQVFKLVTKNTFEEKIELLIRRKGQLMEEVVGVDDDQIVKQFDRDEIIQLLQYVDKRDDNQTSILRDEN